MSTIKELETQYADALSAWQAFPDAEEFTPDRFEELKQEKERLKAKIDAKKSVMEEAENEPANGKTGRQGARSIVTDVRERFQDDPKCGFKNSREFFTAVIRNQPNNTQDARMKHLRIAQTAGSDELSSSSDPYGGFGVPEAFMGDMLKVQAESDFTAPYTRKIPSTAAVVGIPARVDKNHSTSATGGTRWYRRSQTAAITSSRPQMELVKLNAIPMASLSYATEELLQDSPVTFAALTSDNMAEEYGAAILNEKINGTGTGEYEGILNSPALISVTRASATTISRADVTNVFMRCRGRDKAIWIANHNTMSALAAMTTGDMPVFLPSLVDGMPATLMGRPVFFTEYCTTLGTVGDLILCDWSQYLEQEYGGGGLNFATSMHVRFVENEQAVRATVRNDGKCWWRSALTPKNGSTMSPIVTIAT